ncbi:MAG TPA: hypothetical protein RMH99_18770 [Sandaracinaceae bacterium LLY-WYZ-13_1]|nr:hypothetical protein [Sandaracinaceae bacterium LLY-WYZ-13_1]
MDGSRRGGRGGLLGTFANAVLGRTLPRVREWLRSRLGPGASLGALELDGARVHLLEARVPIGALELRVRRATLVTAPEDVVAGRAPVRLERLEGELRGGGGDFTAPVVLSGRPGATAAWIDADVEVKGARWRPAHGVGDAAPMDGTARLRITVDGWALEDAALESGASRIRLSARGSLRDRTRGLTEARLEASEARIGHFLDALTAWTGRPPPPAMPIPWDARLDGRVALTRAGRIDASLTLGTSQSRLALELDAGRDGSVRSGSLCGEIGWDDLRGAVAGAVAMDRTTAGAGGAGGARDDAKEHAPRRGTASGTGADGPGESTEPRTADPTRADGGRDETVEPRTAADPPRTAGPPDERGEPRTAADPPRTAEPPDERVEPRTAADPPRAAALEAALAAVDAAPLRLDLRGEGTWPALRGEGWLTCARVAAPALREALSLHARVGADGDELAIDLAARPAPTEARSHAADAGALAPTDAGDVGAPTRTDAASGTAPRGPRGGGVDPTDHPNAGAPPDAGPPDRPGAGAPVDAAPNDRPGAGAPADAAPNHRPGSGAAPDADAGVPPDRPSSGAAPDAGAAADGRAVVPARGGDEGRAAAIRLDARLRRRAGRWNGDGVVVADPTIVALPNGALTGPAWRAELTVVESRLEARLRVPTVELRPDDAARVALRRIRGAATVDERGATFRADARTGPGTVLVEREDARGPTRLIVQRLDGPTAVALTALASREPSLRADGDDGPGLPWPAGAELWADLVVHDAGLHGRAHLESPRSRLSAVPLRLARGGALDGTELTGTIAVADVASLFRGRLAPQPPGTFDARASLRGTGRRVSLDAILTAKSLAWELRDPPGAGPEPRPADPLVLRDARAELRVGAGHLELRSLTGRLFGGTVRASAALVRADAPVSETAPPSAGDDARPVGVAPGRGHGVAAHPPASAAPEGVREATSHRAAAHPPASAAPEREHDTQDGSAAPAPGARRFEVEARGLSEGLGRWLLGAAGIGRRAPDPQALDALTLDLSLHADGSRFEARVDARDGESQLALRAHARAGRLERRSVIAGSLSTQALDRWLGGPVGLTGPAWRLDGALEGSLRAPELALAIRADAQTLVLRGDPRWRLRLDGPRARVRLGEGRLIWRDATAELLGGTVRTRGALGSPAAGFGGIAAELALEGVGLGDLPLPDGDALGTHLGGTLDASLRLWSRRRTPLSGRLTLAIDAPRHRWLARLAPAFDRVGLPVPPVAGEPVRATLRTDAVSTGWSVEALEAAVPGLRVRAAGDLSARGHLLGTAELIAGSTWLARSAQLARLARLAGDLTVPVRLSGTVRAPRARLDLLGALDHLVADSAPARRLRRALAHLWPDGERRAPPRRHAPTGLLATDTLLDRVAADGDDAAESLVALLERGFTPEQIAARLADRRRR